MADTHLYGIPNCDTMKKARSWLQEHNIDYIFHDYKKEGIDPSLLRDWVTRVGWETLLNRRGMMWRKLSPEQREQIDEASAIAIMLDTPSIIKRPVLVRGNLIEVGFSESRYAEIFNP